MKTYRVEYRPLPPSLESIEDAAWAEIPAGEIDEFPWYASGETQRTTFRILWSDDGLYLRFDCEDRHSVALVTETNGPVSKDSCVEFFVAPNPDKPRNYYNFEVNCVGAVLMGTHCDWGEGYTDRSLEIGMTVRTTLPGPTKQESPDDRQWSLVAHIPWAHFEPDAPHLPPKPGDRWRANLYRIGGRVDPQYGCWSPIDLPQPNYHAPDFFGRLEFVGNGEADD